MSRLQPNRRQILAGLGATLAAPALVTRVNAAELTLRLHHFLPPVAPMHSKFFEPWAKELSDASNGAIEVQIFPAMQLGGKPPQLADQVRKGITDIAWALPTYTPGRFLVAETMGLPFMVTHAEETSVAVHQLMNEFGGDEFKGMQPLAFWSHDGGKLHMRDGPVRTAADLAGKKIRSPNAGMGDLLSSMGAEPVFFPVTEMVVGLSNGVIDGCCLPYEVVPPFKLQELTSYSCEAAPGARGLYANTNALLMNQRSYEALSDDLRAVIDAHSGIELSRRIGKTFDEFEAVGRGMVEKQGNEIVQIEAAEIAKWADAAQPIYAAWEAKLNDAGHDGAAILARANALLDGQA
ncbi:TRAP-type C4-dicarboxylate transport system substrate-binding protein [Primorskyibacter sedentarius]|uniref:TRAP-type C4-dicarboxylate transport system substrate-binding protein n=1 Tax=Primorskyibacter sedentarius TaxID=745311 RepID=A0A4R3JGJ1_9RHOB|nr:TRAP transporter substrate-binding protein [Primorskyibacter sedentarius]TCS64605.1 TRAP-type C4-dicarboxylate transport system substrate-binding protein [Primorskyibacter sedentarius]